MQKSTSGAILALAFGAALMIAGCGGTGVPPDATPNQILTVAERKLADEDYLDAVEILEQLLRANPGSSLVPQARLRLGDARYGLEEYVLARAEYERIVQDHPSSALAEEARFKIARSAYASIHSYDRDPTETEQSIELFDAFLRDYPHSVFSPEARAALAECRGRLARREFETGRFYERRGRKRSAVIQYEYVATQYPESTYAKQALIRLGELYRGRLEWDKAIASYRRVLEIAPGTPEAEIAEEELAELSPQEATP
jgi:outer membrane assembly lipoprotein YfiO